MGNKKIFLRDIKNNEQIKTSLMVMKYLHRDGNKYVFNMSDKSGHIKAKLPYRVPLGKVLSIDCKKNSILDIEEFDEIKDYDLKDYLPTTKEPIENILNEIEEISKKYIISTEGKLLNDYFFKDEEFLNKFKEAIGGVSMHHNYIGGLAEHTLNVMYLTKVLCERYSCKRKEIAILSVKLHDIGKLYELEYHGPFKYTLQGELEGHIVIGVQMLDRAFNNIDYTFSEDFIRRIKGCVTQHHGKIEYGSPRPANMEESFIINYADSVDATMNKIVQIKDNTSDDEWSEYDRRLETKLYL